MTLHLHIFRPHPYLFFNEDGESITFIGFVVKPNKDGKCDLINSFNQDSLSSSIMSVKLFEGLKQQGVNFQDDYTKWNKEIMLSNLAAVMGIENMEDPDKSYALTVDNVIKILAIQMRFRFVLALKVYSDFHSLQTWCLK